MNKKIITCLAVLIGISTFGGIRTFKTVADSKASSSLTNRSKLVDVAAAAIAEIQDYNLTPYREAEQNEIGKIIDDFVTRINAAKTIEEIDSLLSSFNRLVLVVKTDAQLTAEEAENSGLSDQIQITNEEDLENLMEEVNGGYTFEGETVTLEADINLTSHWKTSIGINATSSFKGIFDGKNHTISDLYISKESGCTALFGYAVDATIKNLKMENVFVDSTNETFSSSQRTASVIGRGQRVVLENVHVLSGTIKGTQENGGLIGVIVDGGSLTNCSNKATIDSKGVSIGGLLGNNYSGNTTFEDCVNEGSVTTPNTSCGGLVGKLTNGNVTFKNCINKGAVSGKGHTGGLVGQSANPKLELEDCVNEADVTGTSEGCGGLVGIANKNSGVMTITNCTNNGNVTNNGVNLFGTAGILGLNVNRHYVVIDNCTNNGTVVSKGCYVGGIVGLLRLGMVPGTSAASACNEIKNCLSTGDVTATGSTQPTTGALVGCNRGIIKDCQIRRGLKVNNVELNEPQPCGCEDTGGSHENITFSD